MAKTNSVIPAGLTYCYYGYVNTSGYVIGNQSTDPTAGDGTGAGLGRLYGAKTAPISINEPDRVNATGDDTALAQFSFDSNELPNGVLEFAVTALDVEAIMQGTNTFDVADTRLGLRQPKDVTRPDICLILQARGKSYDSGSRGQSRWHGVIVPVCTITPMGADFSERSPANSRYAITAQNADTLPWGATLQSAVHGSEQAPMIPFVADNPITMHAFQGDNSETVFTLGQIPVSTAKTAVYVNGLVQSSGWTLDTTAKTITFSVAPASGAMITVFYEFSQSE